MIGQTDIKAAVFQSLKPAILVGRKGMGKLTLARELFPSAIVVGNGTDSIKVDEIRGILDQTSNCTEKEYIFRNIDNMTVQSQNAVLKLLEECPEYLRFTLLAEDLNTVLETIRSRCNTYKMSLYGREDFEEYVKLNYPHLKKIDLLENYCMGVLGKVDRIAGKKFKDVRDVCYRIITTLDKISIANVFSIFKHVEPFKEDLDLFLDTLLIMYSDAHLVKLGCEEGLIDFLMLKDYQNLNISADDASRNVSIIDKYKRMIGSSFNFQMFVDNLMLELKGEI